LARSSSEFDHELPRAEQSLQADSALPSMTPNDFAASTLPDPALIKQRPRRFNTL
jgi:hypothetical protein